MSCQSIRRQLAMLNTSYLCKTIYTNCSHRKGDVSTKPQAHTQYQFFQSTKPLDFSETLTEGLNIPILHTPGNYNKNMSAGQVCEPQSKRPTVEGRTTVIKVSRAPGALEKGLLRPCAGLDSIPSKKLYGVGQGQEGREYKQALGTEDAKAGIARLSLHI